MTKPYRLDGLDNEGHEYRRRILRESWAAGKPINPYDAWRAALREMQERRG